MSKFIVRIELHRATEAQYTILHEKMRAAGYVRHIRGGDGMNYQMPTAMYVKNFNSVVSAEAVRNEVAPIAESIIPSAWTLVLRYDEAAWTLARVAAAA